MLTLLFNQPVLVNLQGSAAGASTASGNLTVGGACDTSDGQMDAAIATGGFSGRCFRGHRRCLGKSHRDSARWRRRTRARFGADRRHRPCHLFGADRMKASHFRIDSRAWSGAAMDCKNWLQTRFCEIRRLCGREKRSSIGYGALLRAGCRLTILKNLQDRAEKMQWVSSEHVDSHELKNGFGNGRRSWPPATREVKTA